MSWFPILDRQAVPPEHVEAITIPGAESNYTYRLKYVPAPNRSPIVSFSGLSSSGGGFTLVPHLPTSPGEVYLKVGTGDLTFHQSDSTLSAGNATYNKLASLISAGALNELYGLLTSAEYHHLSMPGVPDPTVPGGDGTYSYIGAFVIPSKGQDTRTITRVTFSAQDILELTGPTQLFFDVGGETMVTDELLVLPVGGSPRAITLEIPNGGWVVGTSAGALLVEVWALSGGHGNLNIEVEVQ